MSIRGSLASYCDQGVTRTQAEMAILREQRRKLLELRLAVGLGRPTTAIEAALAPRKGR